MILAGSLVSAAIAGYHGAPLVMAGADRTAHTPGAISAGHRSFEGACETCHVPFGGVPNERCLRCHAAGLEAGEDAHGESKLADPRNADRVAALDARTCATCHREHVPARTRAGVTQPADLCRACHADIARERPSHASMPFDGCARVGCHRFHDNRALREGFLAEHLGEPENLARAALPKLTPSPSIAAPLGPNDADAPREARTEVAVREWASTAHARAGVNCTHCHETRGSDGFLRWRDKPGDASCGGCHGDERDGFLRGAHGVRASVGLLPLRPSTARLPMKAASHTRALGCESCHGAHGYDTKSAAVEACLGCHDDPHSRGYSATRHARAWQRERRGELAEGSGVTCATCHMPRASRRAHGVTEVRATHDVSAALRPRDKMIRAACTRCHGLGFAIDALADPALAARGFNGRPSAHVESLEMVARRRAARERAGGGR